MRWKKGGDDFGRKARNEGSRVPKTVNPEGAAEKGRSVSDRVGIDCRSILKVLRS